MLGDISSADNKRKSLDGLCAIVLNQLKDELDSRSIYLFCGKRCEEEESPVELIEPEVISVTSKKPVKVK